MTNEEYQNKLEQISIQIVLLCQDFTNMMRERNKPDGDTFSILAETDALTKEQEKAYFQQK